MDRPTHGPPRFWVVAFSVALTCFLGAGAVLVARSRTIVHTTTEHTLARPVLIDPRDCRSNTVCRVSAAPPDARAAVLHYFAGAVRLDDFSVNGDTGNTDRISVRVRTPNGVVVSLTSRCVRDGAAVPARRVARMPSIGPAQVAVVEPGRRGCSTAVVLDVPAGVDVPWDAATALARDRGVQLLPF